MTEPEALDERFREVEREGAGDQEGLTLVRHLLERANTLAPSGRDRLRARAETLLERYRSRSPNPRPARERVDSDRWGELLRGRAGERPPRAPREARTRTMVAEIRATTATERAADRVPEGAGPYHGSTVAARVLEELTALAPGYVGGYVALLEDLAHLAALPDAQLHPLRARRKN